MFVNLILEQIQKVIDECDTSDVIDVYASYIRKRSESDDWTKEAAQAILNRVDLEQGDEEDYSTYVKKEFDSRVKGRLNSITYEYQRQRYEKKRSNLSEVRIQSKLVIDLLEGSYGKR